MIAAAYLMVRDRSYVYVAGRHPNTYCGTVIRMMCFRAQSCILAYTEQVYPIVAEIATSPPPVFGS